MKQIKEYTTIQFIYESKEERDSHVSELESQGWWCTDKFKRFRKGVLPLDANKKESKEYFAELAIDNLIRG